MRKKIVILFIFCLIFIPKNILASNNIENVNSSHIGVYTINNFRPLYEENSKEKVPIASITKVMTAITCIDNISDLNQEVIVDLSQVKKFYGEDYSVAGLRDKQKISYYDLIATMLLPSGADSAACIGLNVFGNYSKFINAMNEKAKEIGMNDTSFSNTIGSDDENNYSTVYDVALMIKYALSNDTIKKFLTDKEYTIKDGTITVHNALFQLAEIYKVNVDKIVGGKTGMTENAKYCLASYSEKDGEELICIVLGSEIKRGTLFHLSDTQRLFEYIDKNYTMKNVISKDSVIKTLPIYKAKEKEIEVSSAEDVKLLMNNNEDVDTEKIRIEYEGMNELSSNNTVGEIVGKAKIYYDNMYLKEIDVVLNNKIYFNIFKSSKYNIRSIIFVIGLILCFLIYVYIKMKYNKLKNKRKYKIDKRWI